MLRPILLAAALAFPLGGCLKRTIQITSEPPGALVRLNDVEIGRTPVETDFTFYGTYDVRLRLEGYEPIVTSREAVTPVYEYPPFDLLAEAVPADISKTIAWHFDLVPTAAPEGPDRERFEQELMNRGRALREQLREGTFLPPPAPASPPPASPGPAPDAPR